MVIRDKNNKKVENIPQYTAKKIRGTETEEYYLCRKYCWDNKTYEMIEWEGLEAYLSKLQLHKRVNRLQLIHYWQNTRRQKQKLGLGTPTLTLTLTLTLEASCPFHCGKEESHLHFMECEVQIAKDARNKILKDTTKKLVNVGVNETIAWLLVKGLVWTEQNRNPIICKTRT